ncbi:hypothetical protein GCM10020331_083900 [Ectobacillus funiculus]
MAPHEQRGRMVTMNEFMIVGGQLLAYVFNAILGVTMADTGHVWRYMLFFICAIPALALFVSMLVVPESPRWLAAKREKKNEALRVLKQIRDEKNGHKLNLMKLKQQYKKDSELEKGIYQRLCRTMAAPRFVNWHWGCHGKSNYRC